MNETVKAYGRGLASRFHLDDAPAFVTRKLQAAEIGVTHIKCDIANNGLTAPIPRDEAILLTVQLRDCPAHDLWLEGRILKTHHLVAGTTCVYDLRNDPVVNSISSFENLHFYLPLKVLNAISKADCGPEVLGADECLATGIDEPVIRALAYSLLPAFAALGRANPMFLDHVMTAVAAYATRCIGTKCRNERSRPERLARWQERRAKEMIDATLDTGAQVVQLAAECRLPVTTFIEAFHRTVGMPPHEWFARRRLDRTLDFLGERGATLEEVAQACGYIDKAQMMRALHRRKASRSGAARPH